MFYQIIECDYCHVVTTNQPAGDGCHACLKGIMKPAESENMSAYTQQRRNLTQGSRR